MEKPSKRVLTLDSYQHGVVYTLCNSQGSLRGDIITVEHDNAIELRMHPCDLDTTASFNHSSKSVLHDNLV